MTDLNVGTFEGDTRPGVMSEREAFLELDARTRKFTPGESIKLEYDLISVNTALPTNDGSLRIRAFSDCYIKFGDSTVIANGTDSIYFPAGIERLWPSDEATHIAVKTANGETGAINIVGLSANYKDTTRTTTTSVLSVGATSSYTTLPSGDYLRIFSMTDCYISFSTEATADDLFFEAGTEILGVPSGATHIAALRYTTNGGLYVTGVE